MMILTIGDVVQVTSRGDTISYAVLAEMDQFETDRLPDYRDIFRSFLQEQIGFHQRVCQILHELFL
jgi:sorting nexin-9/18/33